MPLITNLHRGESVIGIDPSLCGLAVCAMKQDLTFVMRRFTSKAASGLQQRMARYIGHAEEATNIVADKAPGVVFLEGYSFGSRGNAILDMAEFGGVLRIVLLETCDGYGGADVREIAPSAVKRFATGKGNADKLQVSLALAKRYGVQFDTSDEFDAYCITRMAACYVGWDDPQNDAQRGVIESIRNPQAKTMRKTKASA